MALPPSLRTSVIPTELELVASEQLVEIIPLVAMERTAFISVNILVQNVSYKLLSNQL
jgi:GINS complex subunit 2